MPIRHTSSNTPNDMEFFSFFFFNLSVLADSVEDLVGALGNSSAAMVDVSVAGLGLSGE